jgi:glycosyltransferase involved in cell wall biosynthesis
LKKKNVLLLINQLYGGGAQKVIANLSIYLSEYYNVTLAIYNDTDKVVFEHKGELVKLSLPYAEDTHSNPLHKRVMRSFSLLRQVRKLKRTKQIDATISFMEASNIINVLTRQNDKIMISVRSYLSNEFADIPRLKVFGTFIRLLYKRADHIVVPANLLKRDLVNNFDVPEKKVSLIYNFTDFNKAEILKAAPLPAHHNKIFDGGPVIVNVGRINYPKAQWLQPTVLEQIKKIIPDARLVILGDGQLKDKIYESAIRSGLKVYEEGLHSEDAEGNFDVYLLGFTKNPFPYLSKSKVFLMTSVYEGFPNVLVEAMSSGLPVVSSDCPSGPREILSPSTDIRSKASEVEYAEYGVLTPVGSKDGVDDHKYASFAADAVTMLLTDQAKYDNYSKKSLARASDFDVTKIIEQWRQLIEGTDKFKN